MGNMSYCRFENTVNNLQNCYENFEEIELSKLNKKQKYK